MMDFSTARQQFLIEIRQSPEDISLAKAALYIAQEEYTELDVEDYLNAIDTMADAVRERLPSESYPLRIIQTLNRYLYDDLGYSGNQDQYYDPRNSYLNDVIDRRTGIPITLSLLYLELCQRLEFPMVGIGMPGHFLIRPTVNDMEVFVDPFNNGEVLFPEDCQARLEEIYGQPIEWRSQFLEPVDAHRFLARMLTNLKFIHLNGNELSKALADIERILLLYPDALQERRDRGLLYYQTGRWIEASYDLQTYLDGQPSAQDAAVVRQLLKRMEEG
jgi:regulator of sirC expression with transglutaminase-like and TPR domain